MPDLASRCNFTDEWTEAGALVDLIGRGRPLWFQWAACREAPLSVSWFLDRGEDPRPARQVCDSCVVAGRCLEWALAMGDVPGIWAGTSQAQRRKLRPPPPSPRPTRRPPAWREFQPPERLLRELPDVDVV